MAKNEYQTKDMKPKAASSEETKIPYSFSGEGKYEPITIEATTYEEALKIYEETRVEIINE